MPTVIELRKKRMTKTEELRKFHEEATAPEKEGGEARDYTPEQSVEFDKREKELGAIEVSLGREERLEDRERRASASRAACDRTDGPTPRDGNDRAVPARPSARQSTQALQAWVKARRGLDITSEQGSAMEALGINPKMRDIDVQVCNGEELRAIPQQIARAANFSTFAQREVRADMGVGAGVGGELVPEGFVNRWEIALLAISQLRNAAEIMRTATGNDLPWPTTDDTGVTGELLAEGAAAAEAGIATGSIIFKAYKYSSKMIIISTELMTDSAFNMAQKIGELAGTRIARITNTHFTTGDGSDKPNGIVTASAQAFVMANLDEILPDEIMRAPYEIDPEYQAGPNTGWMMHNLMVAQVRLLRDSSGGAGTGQYLWQPGLQAGQPDRLNGWPVLFNQDMESTFGANKKIILFGALGKYVIRDAGPVRLRHLVELHAATDQEAFIAFSRHDGDLVDAGTEPVKHLAMAAS